MLREISLAEVKRHNNENSDWLVIHNEVYDVTKYLSEHPGGEETLLEVAGQVATQSFEDVGHSDDAREIMKKYKIGALPANEHTIPYSENPKVGDMELWCTAWNREYVVYPAKASQKCCGPDKAHDPVTSNHPGRKIDGSPSLKRPRGPPCDEGAPMHGRHDADDATARELQPSTATEQRSLCSVSTADLSSSNWWWKWALLALAGAITVGLLVKKKMGT